MPRGPVPKPPSERFWPKVDRSGGPDACWPWTASRLKRGYGRFFVDPATRRLELSHRVAWELTYGPIPTGLLACHSCDNPPCCNPLHLFLGSHYDNMMDRASKRRNGERLSPEAVEEIRRLYDVAGLPFQAIALRFAVAPSTISRAYYGKTWKESP